MSAIDDFVASLKARGPEPLKVAVGSVRVSGAPLVAEVRGITVDPILVEQSSWCSPFVASVAAGSVENRLVLVVFNAGQAIIVSLMGV